MLKKLSIKKATALTNGAEPRKKFIRLQFAGNSSYKLFRELRRMEYTTAFYSSISLRSLLSKLKDPVPRVDRTVVYRLQVPIYVGQIGRSLESRVQEHFGA